MKSFLSIPLVFLAVALLLGCGGARSGVASTDLVPANASFIAQLQVEKLLQNPDFADLYRQTSPSLGGPPTLDDVLDEAQEETGVDFRQFRSVVLFADHAREGEYFGVIARGPVDEEQLISALKDSGEYVVETTDYAGQRIYLDQEDDDNPAIAFLDADTAVLGALAAVQDVIDVRQGKLARASGMVYDTFQGLGEPLFSLALALPPEAARGLQDSVGAGTGFGMMPALDEALADLDIVSLVLDQSDQDLRIEANLDFRSAQSAQEVGDTLDSFIKLAAGFAPDPTLRGLLGKLEFTVQGSRLTVGFQAPMSELKEVARAVD